MNDEDLQERYRQIERRAFERYVLEVVREAAAEEERILRELRNEDFNVLVRSVELVREYPQTGLRFQLFDRGRGIERQTEKPIWDEDYMRPDGEMRSASFIAGEILRMVRGG